MRVLFGIEDSVTGLHLEIVRSLQEAGHEIQVTLLQPSHQLPCSVLSSCKEGQQIAQRFGEAALRSHLIEWAEILVVAPLDATVLARFSCGFSDNLLESVFRGWDPQKPILLVPMMDQLTWDHPHTEEQMRKLVRLNHLSTHSRNRKSFDVTFLEPVRDQDGVVHMVSIQEIVRYVSEPKIQNATPWVVPSASM